MAVNTRDVLKLLFAIDVSSWILNLFVIMKGIEGIT